MNRIKYIHGEAVPESLFIVLNECSTIVSYPSMQVTLVVRMSKYNLV
jgi:hypothetical protein